MEDYMQELKGQQIWMLWRFEIRKEKRTKVPRSALDGGPSGSDESWSHTWVTYDEAVYARFRTGTSSWMWITGIWMIRWCRNS